MALLRSAGPTWKVGAIHEAFYVESFEALILNEQANRMRPVWQCERMICACERDISDGASLLIDAHKALPDLAGFRTAGAMETELGNTAPHAFCRYFETENG